MRTDSHTNHQDAEAPPPREASNTPSADYLRIGAKSMRELEGLMVRGETPDLDAIAGWEYRGLNTPPFARLLGIKKFIKGFYKDTTGKVFGYNMATQQTASLQAPWEYKNPGRAQRFGYFRVDTVDAESRDNAYLHSLILDYGRGGNRLWDPTSTLRDYVVRIDPGSDDLLLGKAYVAVGPLRVPVSYFVLERRQPTSYQR